MRRRPGKLTIRGLTRRAVFERSTWNNQREDVVVEVEDTGCGIAAERLPRLFAPFAGRGDQSDGTGLGLTICKQLVEGAGGAISVRSKVDEGTCFTITLPPAAEPTATELRHERVKASGM
jgi:signal transduction histidine kinase